MAGRWLDVGQAARELGLSTDAVRKRIARGSLASEERDGRRVVWLDSGGTTTGHGATPESGELVEELRSRVRSLERQLEEANTRDRENRRLLAAALERVPELEAQEAAEAPQNASAGGRGGEAAEESTEAQGAAPRPWWRRLLLGR